MFQCRKITGFTNYFVTTEGDVYSCNSYKGFIKRSPKKERTGYLRVDLYAKGIKGPRFIPIHRLVAKAFIPNPEGKPHVNHINNIRDDNRVENLEWCTPKENHAHAIRQGRRHWAKGEDQWKSRFKEADILEMRRLFAAGYSQAEIGRLFDTSGSVVRNIVLRKRWAHI